MITEKDIKYLEDVIGGRGAEVEINTTTSRLKARGKFQQVLTTLLNAAKLVLSAEGLPEEKELKSPTNIGEWRIIGYNECLKEVTPLFTKLRLENEELKKGIVKYPYQVLIPASLWEGLEQQLKELRERAGRCVTCGEIISNNCERCKRLLES